MKRREFLQSMAATLLIAGCGSSNETVFIPDSPEPAATPRVTARQIQTIVDDAWSEFLAEVPGFRGCVVAHADAPSGSFDATAGETKPDPANVHFRCGSVTKTWTAAAIMLLQQEGRLNIDHTLDDLIPGTDQRYLPLTPDWNIPNRSQITLRLLLSHRAGVFDVTNQDIPDTSSQPYAGQRWFDWLLAQDPTDTVTVERIAQVVSIDQLSNFLPDAQYRYSNTGYALLTAILQRITGLRYDQFVAQRFFQPLGLDSTRAPYLGTDQTVDSPFYTGFLTINGVTTDKTLDNMSENVGEGNVITTMRDLSTWIRALFTAQTPLQRPGVEEMMELIPTGDGDSSYGLGVAFNPGLGYGHSGAHAGYITICFFDPESDTNITVMVNNLDNRNIGAELRLMYDLAGSLKDALEGRVPDDDSEDTSDFDEPIE